MKFAIRVDDLGWTPEPTDNPPHKVNDRGLLLAQRFHEAMGGVPYLGAVIPTCVDADGLGWLQSNPRGLTVAIHGLDHSMRGTVANEFYGLSVPEMRARLKAGRELLRTNSPHLVPPFNGLEYGLAQAAYHEGIRYIWSGPKPDRDWYAANGRWHVEVDGEAIVTFLHAYQPLYGATLWRMQPHETPIVEWIHWMLPTLAPHELAVITLHLTWEASKSKHFDGVKRLLELVGDRVISPEEYCANLELRSPTR